MERKAQNRHKKGTETAAQKHRSGSGKIKVTENVVRENADTAADIATKEETILDIIDRELKDLDFPELKALEIPESCLDEIFPNITFPEITFPDPFK